MEIDKIRNPNRLNIIRTIDKKRTISSQQGHYSRLDHQRKFTLDYNDSKKPTKSTIVPRKNHSLPRTLTSCSNDRQQPNVKSRKLIYSSQSKHNDYKSPNKIPPQSLYNSEAGNKIDYANSQLFKAGIDLFKQDKYENALGKFLQLEKQAKQTFAKNLYYIGLCYWYLQITQKAVLYLSKAMDEGYGFSTETYQLLSQFYEDTKNYICELKTLDHWLKSQSNPKAYLMRARINFQFKQYEKAIKDYQQCYRIQPTKLQAYIEEAEATYKLNGIKAGLEKYNNLLVKYKTIWPQFKHDDINYVKYKKGVLLLQQKSYEAALSLLKQVTNPQLQSQVGYYIGIIYTILNELQEASLAFAKAIQFNTSQKFVGQCYYEKFVIMFKRNDYYGIQHQFDMLGDKFIENQALYTMRKVIQAIIYILKMHFNQGIKAFSQISDNPCFVKNAKIYLSTVTSFKIFAYYSLHQFDKALQEFGNMKNKKFSQSNLYNLTMLRAIKASQAKDFNQSFGLFKQAQNIEPFNTHTFMVKAIVQIMFYISMMASKDVLDKQEQNTNQQILLSAEELLNRCFQKQPQNDQILYVLATINYELGQYEAGLKLVRKAIDVSDDHTIKHYYLKANLKLMLGMVAEAISDYSNGILVMTEQQSLKEEQQDMQAPIQQCYLQRAKCYIMQGQFSKAEADLRLFFSNLSNVKRYVPQLDLFMHVGCSTVILDIYKSILDQQYDPYKKMKCYYLSKELNNCLNMMNILLEFENEENEYQDEDYDYNAQKLKIDRDCLQALKKSSQGPQLLIKQALHIFEEKIGQKSQGQIFKKSDCMFYAGVMAYHLQDYGKAKNYFIDSKGEKLLANQICNLQQQEESQVENTLFNLQQINYNIGICDYVQGKWSNYLQIYPEFKKQHEATTQNFISSIQEITPFQIKNRLCSIYPVSKKGKVTFRLSFCLPKIKLSQIKIVKNDQLIKSITLKDIDMRPSAPWIQKSKKGIIFTSDILKDSIDLKSQKSKKVNNLKKKGPERYKDSQYN